MEASSGFLMAIFWVVPPPSNSHHQDYYIFSRGSQPKPSFATGIVGGVVQPKLSYRLPEGKFSIHPFRAFRHVLRWSAKRRLERLPWDRGGVGELASWLSVGVCVSCVLGSKLPLFPYNRGWSSTQ